MGAASATSPLHNNEQRNHTVVWSSQRPRLKSSLASLLVAVLALSIWLDVPNAATTPWQSSMGSMPAFWVRTSRIVLHCTRVDPRCERRACLS